MKKIFKNKLFMTSMVADLVSNFGDVVFYLALMNYILQLPEAKYAIALITIFESIPGMLAMFAGYYADKTKNKVKMLLATLGLRIVLYTVVGLVLGFTPALWIVLVIIGINFVSDMAGEYENGLYATVSLKITEGEDRESFMAFRQTVFAISRIAFNAISAVLVVYLSYQMIVALNVLTFALSLAILLMIYKPLSNLIKDEEVIEETSSEGVTKQEKLPFWQDLKEKANFTFKEVRKIPELFTTILLAPFFNGITLVLSPLLVLSLSQNKSMVIVNEASTIATFSVVSSIAGIVGGILGMSLFKKISLLNMIKLNLVGLFVIFLAFYSQHIYVTILATFILVLLISGIGPKLNALVMNKIDSKNLALMVGFMNSYAQVGNIFMTLAFSGLVILLSAKSIALIFVVVVVLISMVVLHITRKN